MDVWRWRDQGRSLPGRAIIGSQHISFNVQAKLENTYRTGECEILSMPKSNLSDIPFWNERIKLPVGLDWETAERAVSLVGKWEESGEPQIYLAIRIFNLFKNQAAQ